MKSEGIFMSVRNLVKARIVEDFRAGKLSRKETAVLLGVSERSISRWTESHRQEGIHGLRHRNSGKEPVNKIDCELAKIAIKLAEDVYPDFNMSHCLEMLKRNHDITLSYTKFQSLCREAGIGKRRKRRAKKIKLLRDRMANEGMFLQMDGSHHFWNGVDEWCLIALIDDATSNIPAAAFYEGETTWACMKTLRMVIETKGVPEVIYTDQAGWAGGSAKRPHFAQFVRACEELGIRVITTPSAESKGRIERTWYTMQDRLVPEMRLYGIKVMKDANRYLQQTFLPAYWHERNTVVAANSTTRYRSVPKYIELDEVLCMKHWRTVRRDHCVSYDNQTYRIINGEIGPLKGKEVAIHVKEDGSVSLFYGSKRLSTQLVVSPTRRWLKKRA